IDELTETMRLTALCGLGHSTAVPVQTSIQNFRKEYLAHIDRDYCPVCAQAAVAEGIYEAEEDYRNDGNSRMGRRRAAVGERDVMYDSYDAYARHRSRGTSYAGRFERRGGREA
ncbi:NADH-ubiquinone oxidoreductase-F iron-sulfur binding region domain-containing protein, partial [Clostridium sp.]